MMKAAKSSSRAPRRRNSRSSTSSSTAVELCSRGRRHYSATPLRSGAQRMNASEKNTTETVLERARGREVTGVFHSRHALDAAAHALLLAGFDRADVDVVASLDQIRERIGAFYVAPEELAAVPPASRRPLTVPDDLGRSKVVVASTLGSIAAGATVFLMMSPGAGNAETGVAA